MRGAIIAVFCISLQMAMATPISTDEDDAPPVSEAGALSYLMHFGHARALDPNSGNLLSREELENSIKKFQQFAGLPRTGQLDKDTLKKMGQKRCGNPDYAGTENTRKRRYALQGTKWPKKTLTYNFVKYSTGTSTQKLYPTEIKLAVAEALKYWEDASGLSFQLVDDRAHADIKISFEKGAHGDGDPFDGKGKTLAHAYFPYPNSEIGGDAHFDDEEKWLMTPSRDGTSLVIAGAHEFGHSLGLSHSDVQASLMAPFYNPTFKGLHKDDIDAIQALYGEPENKHKATTTKRPRTRSTTKRPYPPKKTTTTTKPSYSKCNGRFDAITQMESTGKFYYITEKRETYAFAGEVYWRLNDESMDEGYPRTIKSDWKVDGPIDAALTHDKITYLFKGKHVHQFTHSKNGPVAHGGRLPINSVFKGAPNDIDAAFVWSGNGKIYFMKGNQYWRYNPNLTSKQVDEGYPKPLSIWKGLPKEGVDAALQWNKKTYFFANGFYWKFDDETIKISENLQMPYPRRSDEWWLGCRDNTLMTSYGEEINRNKNDPTGHASTASAGVAFTLFAALVAVVASIAV